VTPYLFLLFVSNMQSMKVDTQPRLLSWFKNLSVSHQPRVQICPLSLCLFLFFWNYFWNLWLSNSYSEWSSSHWKVGLVPASRADEF